MITGIILAGGKGTRLSPITLAVSKQLLPIYNKPMIYYPLNTLMSIGIKDILIITTPQDAINFRNLLGNGHRFGISISYGIQDEPRGIADAFVVGDHFIYDKVALILGDNIFHGHDFISSFKASIDSDVPANIFTYEVKDPERYGVAEVDFNQTVISIEEKPSFPKSKLAVTGFYVYDETVSEYVYKLKPSKRNELEITDLNLLYLKDQKLKAWNTSKGSAWLDTGTIQSLNEASAYIEAIEHRQGIMVGCPEETAYKNGWLNKADLKYLACTFYSNTDYGNYLLSVSDA
jgi:glucose-1-phosphate thymidylyltransferase